MASLIIFSTVCLFVAFCFAMADSIWDSLEDEVAKENEDDIMEE